MPFPDSQRVIYDRNPLEEVVCQVKFPPILKIDSAAPAAFQDEIRGTYPLLQEVPGILVDLPAEIMKMLPSFGGTKSYSFESSNREWKIALNREFLALSTTKYVKWEDFRSRLTTVLNALDRHYQPNFFVRVGLRYRDVIRRASLGLQTVGWPELLQPWILGELSHPALASHIQQALRDVLISLNGETGQVRLRHGLAKLAGEEEAYTIDSDFFREGTTEKGNAIELLNIFNREAGKLFRLCIRDPLHERLGPQPVPAVQLSRSS